MTPVKQNMILSLTIRISSTQSRAVFSARIATANSIKKLFRRKKKYYKNSGRELLYSGYNKMTGFTHPLTNQRLTATYGLALVDRPPSPATTRLQKYYYFWPSHAGRETHYYSFKLWSLSETVQQSIRQKQKETTNMHCALKGRFFLLFS